MGRGDLHNTKYNGMLKSRKVHQTFNMNRYSGAPFNSDDCPYTLNIYPSVTFQNLYTTNNAIIFATIVVLIFAFVTCVFLIYDTNVERRQQVVLNNAVKTNNIVSSLFPSSIREQMLQPDPKRKKFTHSVQEDSTQAMASLYPETTICFADLGGFTAWSRCVQSRLNSSFHSFIRLFLIYHCSPITVALAIQVKFSCYLRCYMVHLIKLLHNEKFLKWKPLEIAMFLRLGW
jgi:hypothetical protein